MLRPFEHLALDLGELGYHRLEPLRSRQVRGGRKRFGQRLATAVSLGADIGRHHGLVYIRRAAIGTSDQSTRLLILVIRGRSEPYFKDVAGVAASKIEDNHAWTDAGREPETMFSLDEMLDNISLYWLTGTATSSSRLYWESGRDFKSVEIEIPTGCSLFPKDIIRPSRRWAERSFRNIVHWNELDRGGHFAAFEQPDLFTEEVRACFRQFRRA